MTNKTSPMFERSAPITIKRKTESSTEYSLQSSIFDPSKHSPNIFMNKLHDRMNKYYNQILNSECKLISE